MNQKLQKQFQQLQQQFQQLQQQLQQEKNFSRFKILILESVIEIVAKRLSEWSGESEEAIMSSAVEQTDQKIKSFRQGQVPGSLEDGRSKKDESMT